MKRYLILLSLMLAIQSHSSIASWFDDKYITIPLTQENGGWRNVHFELDPVYVYVFTPDFTYKFTREHYQNASPNLLLERAYTEVYKTKK
jgi:hypothetical protein